MFYTNPKAPPTAELNLLNFENEVYEARQEGAGDSVKIPEGKHRYSLRVRKAGKILWHDVMASS